MKENIIAKNKTGSLTIEGIFFCLLCLSFPPIPFSFLKITINNNKNKFLDHETLERRRNFKDSCSENLQHTPDCVAQ